MNTKDVIKKFIQSELINSSQYEISDSDSLIEKGIVDSLGIFKLSAFLQETFSIQVNSDEMIPENFETTNALTDFVERKRKVVS